MRLIIIIFLFAGKAMGKSMEKPFSIAAFLATSGGNNKKMLSRNKPKPSDKGRSSIVETHSKSTHDLPLPPLKRHRVVNIEDGVEPASCSLIVVSKIGGPPMWMSSG